MRFGFTGNSTIISTWSKNLGQWWYILFTTIGTALTSISASFINNNYDLAEKINSVNSLWTLSNFAFHSPYTYLAAGIASIFYGSRGTYNDQKNLNEINEQLKSENLSVERLKKKIDSIAEDSESLLDKLAERHTKLVEMWLKLVSKNLKLGSYDRVSIYYHVKEHFYASCKIFY